MLGFIKKLFGATPAETPAPYKVETPVAPVAEEVKPTVKKAAARKPKAEGEKTPAVKAKTARKPRAPKA